MGDGRGTRGERLFPREFWNLHNRLTMGAGTRNISYGTEASWPSVVFGAVP